MTDYHGNRYDRASSEPERAPMSTTEEVAQRLERHFTIDLHCAVATPTPGEWEAMTDLDDVDRTTGITVRRTDKHWSTIVILFCPSVVADLVAGADDVDAALELLELAVDLWVVAFTDEPSLTTPAEYRFAIETAIVGIDATAAMSLIELREKRAKKLGRTLTGG